MALSKQNRLSKKKDIENILKRGKRASFSLFRIFFQFHTISDSRFAFVISRKVSKKAVIRNRLRRRAAAWIYAHHQNFKKGDYIIFFLPPAASSSRIFFYEDLKRAFKTISGYM